VTVAPPTTTAPPPVPTGTLPKPSTRPVETRPHTVTAAPQQPHATAGFATGSSSSSSTGSSPAYGQATPTTERMHRRSTSLPVTRFHLARPATVRVTVWQESPQCRLFGRFRVAGSHGRNALRLPRRIGKHELVVGRYRLVGVARGRSVIDERIRVERAKGRLRVRKTRVVDECLPSAGATILSGTGLLSLARPGSDDGNRSSSAPTSGVRGATKSASRQAAPAGARSVPGLPRLAASVQRTLLFVLLALAIALLGVSSLPASAGRGTAAAAALATHRAALTSAGLAMIVAAALALLLT
jgi:hypothetical protein